ncbi:unnamed protein product [Ectocarpus sp. 4 AP-2014]
MMGPYQTLLPTKSSDKSTWEHTKAPTHGHTRRLTRKRGLGSNRTSDISSGATGLESFDDDDAYPHVQHSRHFRQSRRNPLIIFSLLAALALGCGCWLRWFFETTPRKRSKHNSASTAASSKPSVAATASRIRSTFRSSDLVPRAEAKTPAGQGLVWTVHVGQPSDSGHGREQENTVSSSGNGNIAREAVASSSNGKPDDPEAGRALFESAQLKGSTGIVGTGRGDLSGPTDLFRKVVGPTNDRGGKELGSSDNTEEDRARMIGTTGDRDSVGWAHQEEREGRGKGRGIRHSEVPDWERPSKAEVEDILLGQFGDWRTLGDAVARTSLTSHSTDKGAASAAAAAQHQPQPASSTPGDPAPPASPLRRVEREQDLLLAKHPPRSSKREKAQEEHAQRMRGELRRQKQQASGHTRGGGEKYPGKKCPAMKQGTEPVPEEDVQSCYDEMRKEFVFGEPLRQLEVVTMGEKKLVKDSPRGVVTYMSTSRTDDITALTQSLQTLSKSFLAQHPYPVAIIHEDFTTDLMKKIRGMVPVPIHFVKVAFKLPDWMEPLSWIYPLAVKQFTGHPKSEPVVGYHSEMRGLLPYVKRGGFGYFHMCRFFAGAGYMLPFFDDFDFYFRLDSDSLCARPIPDHFSALEDAGADYAFGSTFLDYGGKTQGLWNFAEAYMRDHNISPTFWSSPNNEVARFRALVAARSRAPYPRCEKEEGRASNNVDRTPERAAIHHVPCRDRHFQAVPAFYTNFEVARIQMLRSSWYQDWFNAVDKTGSIFYNRWGDAPIRFLGLAMHLPADKILEVQGCRHD